MGFDYRYLMGSQSVLILNEAPLGSRSHFFSAIKVLVIPYRLFANLLPC